MFLTIDQKRVCLPLNSSETTIWNIVKSQLVWPKNRAYLNWDGKKVEIADDGELMLAVKMMGQELYHEFSSLRGEFEIIEKKLQSETVDYSSDDGVLKSDDDMTQEDFYMMGYRHEIT